MAQWLINAKALKDSFCETCSTKTRYKRTIEECRVYMNKRGDRCFKMRLINNAPAVDAEPVRHGKWMICYYNEESKEHESVTYNPYTFRNPDGAMFCSECGLDALRNVHAEHVPSAWCPHCGAVMDLNEVDCK